MILTKDMLMKLEPQELVFEIFKVFHDVLNNVTEDELEDFMTAVIDETNKQYGELGYQEKAILKLTLEAEKKYRSTYKS
jgi:uncharacterized protein YggL (DUF469 family)